MSQSELDPPNFSCNGSENSDQENQENNKSKQQAVNKLIFHKLMNELQRAKNKRKHKKCFEMLSNMISDCLANYNIIRDLKIIHEFQNFVKQVVYLHRYRNSQSKGLKSRYAQSFVELDLMLFNFRYFSLNIYITKILNKQHKVPPVIDNSNSWGHLYPDDYFPKNADLKYFYLNFIRYNKFQDDTDQYIKAKDAHKGKKDKQQIQEMIEKQAQFHENFVQKNVEKGSFRISNNFIKDFVINEARQKEMMAEDFNVYHETNEFIKKFLDLMIFNGYNCKKNKQFRTAYQYYLSAYNCCLTLEKYQNLVITAYCIKVRLMFSAFLLELKKYHHAEEILVHTLQLQQFELIKLDYHCPNFKEDHEQIYYKKVNTLICTLINLLQCYKHTGQFEQLNEVLHIIQMLNSIEIHNNIVELLDKKRRRLIDVKKMFKQVIEKIMSHKLAIILQSIGEIRQLTSDLLQQDLFLHQLGKKEKAKHLQQIQIFKEQFRMQIPSREMPFKDLSSRIMYRRRVSPEVEVTSQQTALSQFNAKKEVTAKPTLNQSSTRVIESRDSVYKQRSRTRSEQITLVPQKQSQLFDKNSAQTKNQNFCDSFELDQSFNFEQKSSLLSIKDLKKQINQKFSKQLNYKLCRREFQLSINEDYKPQLVMEESYFDDYKDNSHPIPQKKQQYDDIHMSRLQVKLAQRRKIKNPSQPQPDKDLSFEDQMKDKIASTERLFLYQNFTDIEKKQAVHDKNQLQYEKKFNFYKKILRFKSREAIRTHKNIQYGIPGKPHKVVVDKKQSKEILGFQLNDQIEKNRQARKIRGLINQQRSASHGGGKQRNNRMMLKQIILRHPEVFNLQKWCQKNNPLNENFQKKQSQTMLQTIIHKKKNQTSSYNNLTEESKKKIYSMQYKQTNQINLKSLDDSKAKLLIMNQPLKTKALKRQSKFLLDFNDLALDSLK